MTPALSAFLDSLYDSLPLSSSFPVGRYAGVFPSTAVQHLWHGKVFTGSKVVNVIRGREAIEGDVQNVNGLIVIRYPILPYLVDYLKPSGDGWLGKAVIGSERAYFLLVPIQ